MAFLDLHEGIAELFGESSAGVQSRRDDRIAEEWFMQNRVGRHAYTPPVPPLACEVSCLQCRKVMANARALQAHAWQCRRRQAVTCCVCRESFGHRVTFLEHYAAKHQEANIAASRINLRIARAARS